MVNISCLVPLLSNLSGVHSLLNVSIEAMYSVMLYKTMLEIVFRVWQHTQRENIHDMVMGLNPMKHNSKVSGSNLANRHSGSSVSVDSTGGERPLPCQHNQLKNSGMVMGLNPINHNDRVSGSNLVHCSNSVSDDIAGGGGLLPLYDVNSVGVEEKFANSIIHSKQFNESSIPLGVDSPIFKKWRSQSDFQFGFIPLGDQLMPTQSFHNSMPNGSLIDAHYVIRHSGKPNFFGARIPVTSQLNVDKWEELLQGYWDQQLLQLLRFGFPLDFNRSCPLQDEQGKPHFCYPVSPRCGCLHWGGM